MNLDKQDIYKYLSFAGLITFVLLLVNLQVLFAIIILVVAIASWFLSKQA